jgi:hypothetical protein
MPLLLEATTGDPAITYHAQDFRGIVSTLAPNQGVVHAGDLAVSQRAAGANLSVDVAAGRCIIAGGSIANQGTYIALSDAVQNVPIATPNATNPRIDIVVAQIHDKQADGGTSYGWTINTVQGVAASSPVAPSTPTSALLLAQVAVAANATSITTANITDRRPLAGVGDIPKWDFSGTSGTPQTIAANTDTNYAPGSYAQSVGILHHATLAQVTAITPGRYVVTLGARFTSSTNNGDRHVWMRLYDTDGTTLLKEIAAGASSNFNTPLVASGTVYMTFGQTLKAGFWQATGQTISVDDHNHTVDFTGAWVGP